MDIDPRLDAGSRPLKSLSLNESEMRLVIRATVGPWSVPVSKLSSIRISRIDDRWGESAVWKNRPDMALFANSNDTSRVDAKVCGSIPVR